MQKTILAKIHEGHQGITKCREPAYNNFKSIFAELGFPEIFATDNGSQFASQTLKLLIDAYGFSNRTSSTIYPQSNGVSERAVKTIKCVLTKSEDKYETLIAYRSTPLSNGYSPVDILIRRNSERLLRCYHHG